MMSLALVTTATQSNAATASTAAPSSAVSKARAALRSGSASASYGTYDFCAANGLYCQASYLTRSRTSTKALASSKPIGYGADDLQKAYGLVGASSTHGTIAILDAGAYPTLEADLKVYRKTYGLPACTVANKCLTIASYTGGKPLKPSKDEFLRFIEEEVAMETALDVQMASAACPLCKIVELQLPTIDAAPESVKGLRTAVNDFATATKTAVKLGANAVSISYGYPTDKFTDKGAPAKALNQPGVAIVASSGDSGFAATFASWPQNLRTVISVGGTSLYQTGTKRGFTETAWGYAGSSCSADLGPAVGQPTSVSKQCGGKRAGSDISAVADPVTGVAVYDSYAPLSQEPYGWIVAGGTSVSAPLIAGMIARSPHHRSVLGPNWIYAAKKSAFNDVTLGQNAPSGVCTVLGIGNKVCTSGVGWDGPTGVGTPKGLAAFK